MGFNTSELTMHQIIELYQYLDLFTATYNADDSLSVGEMKAVLKEKYAYRTKGGDIAVAKNPVKPDGEKNTRKKRTKK